MPVERTQAGASDSTLEAGIVDANSCFGPGHGRLRGATLGDLVRERRDHGIQLVLARSLVAVAADAAVGNADVYEQARDPANGIAPVAVVWPRGKAGATAVATNARDGGAVAFWLEDPWFALTASTALTDAATEIAGLGRPLFVPVGQPGDLNSGMNATTIGRLTSGLGIPVVLVAVGYGQIAEVVAAATHYEHLLVETSRIAHWRGIETLVSQIGAERVVYGSGGPRRAAQSGINSVLLANLNPDDKRAILGGNAIRLFALAAPEPNLPIPSVPDRSWDVHTHHGAMPLDVPAAVNFPTELAAYGTAIAAASSAFAIFGDPEQGNLDLVNACAVSPALRAYVFVDPTDLEFSRTQIERHGERDGVIGVKVHAEWSRSATSSTEMSELFDLLATFGKPVLIHNSGSDWHEGLQRIARRHSALPIIIAHGGLGSPSVEAARVVTTSENVYVELASSVADIEVTRTLVRLVGPDRLLWGSDAPLLDPAFVLGTYQDANLDPSWVDRVFWENANTLFG